MRDTFFVYNNDDTVFVYDKIIAGFTPLYIFNVAVGDTVCLRQPNTKLTATDPIGPEFCIIIDSIKQETYGTEQLTSYYNHTLDTAQFNQLTINWGVSKWMGGGVGLNRYRNAGKYTTKIGGNWPEAGSFFPEVSLQNPDYYKKISLPTGTFRCYKDAVTDIKALPEACDFITSIADLRQSEYQISVSPNPSNGIFTLTAQKPLKEALSIQVTDLSGRTMHTTALPAGKTELTGDLSALSSGIYVLLLQTGDQRYYQKLVISR